MTPLEAKFAREAKDRPADWVIYFDGHTFQLGYIGAVRHDARRV